MSFRFVIPYVFVKYPTQLLGRIKYPLILHCVKGFPHGVRQSNGPLLYQVFGFLLVHVEEDTSVITLGQYISLSIFGAAKGPRLGRTRPGCLTMPEWRSKSAPVNQVGNSSASLSKYALHRTRYCSGIIMSLGIRMISLGIRSYLITSSGD